MSVLRDLRAVSAVAFYLLGASFFVGWVYLRNGIRMTEIAVWMQVMDLPLLLSAIVYGGTSLYLSIADAKKPSRTAGLIIAVPLALFFAVMLSINFLR